MLETYLQDLAEVVNLDCGSANCEGVTKVANIMKRHFDSIGFATELVDLGPKAGKGLFATNKLCLRRTSPVPKSSTSCSMLTSTPFFPTVPPPHVPSRLKTAR